MKLKANIIIITTAIVIMFRNFRQKSSRNVTKIRYDEREKIKREIKERDLNRDKEWSSRKRKSS